MLRVSALLLLLLGLAAPAQALDLSQATELERQLFADARDGSLSRYSMMDAAFIASGLPDADSLSLYRSKYQKLLAKVRRLANREEGDLARARVVFETMHATALSTYGLHSVDMVGLFARGEYNCVSATILYNALLSDMGIESWGILVPSHAYSVVHVEGKDVDVETTSPKGFDPVRTDDTYRQLLRQYRLDGALFEANDGRRNQLSLIREVQGKKQPVSNLTMVAVIYSNLAAARVRDGDLQGALANFVKASALSDENPHFKESRDALLNNLVVDLIEGERYAQAAAAALAARQIPGLGTAMLEKLGRLQGHAVTKQALALMERSSFEPAIALYDAALATLPNHELLLHNRKAGYINWGIALNGAGEYRLAATTLLRALTLYRDEEIVQNNYLATVQKYIRSRLAVNDLDHALTIARHAHQQAANLFEQGGEPREMLLRLQMEIGLVLFKRKAYAESIEYFVPGLATGKDLYAANYLAASGNLAKTFLDSGRPKEAYTAVSAALRLVGDEVANRHQFYATYWPAALGYAESLKNAGKMALALQIATSAPASTIAPKNHPVLYRAYWRQRLEILAAMGLSDQCRQHLDALEEAGDTDWRSRLRSQCDGGR